MFPQQFSMTNPIQNGLVIKIRSGLVGGKKDFTVVANIGMKTGVIKHALPSLYIDTNLSPSPHTFLGEVRVLAAGLVGWF